MTHAATHTRRWLAALLCLLAAGVAVAAAQKVKLGEPFPTFSGEDVITGETVDFAEFRGKVVVVEFWATWCGWCGKAIPKMRDLYTELHDRDLDIISLALERESGKLKPYIQKEKMVWHQLDGKGSEIHRLCGIRGIPAALVIDRDGILVWAGNPLDGKPSMESVIRETLKKEWKGCTEAEAKAKPEFDKADALRQEGKAKEAAEAYEAVIKQYAGTPSASAARKLLQNLDTDPAILKAKAETVAASECTRWLKYARDQAAAGRTDMARKYFQKIIDQHPDAEEAKAAAEELAKLPK